MNKKIIGSYSVAVLVFVLIVVSKVVPLKTVTEEFGTETFSLDSYGPISISTTLVVRKGWDVSGNFSGTCQNYQGEDASAWAGDELSFYILGPPPRTAVVFRSVGALSGVFNFTAEEGGDYKVLMSNTEAYFETIITLTLEANQTGKIPLW